MGLEWWQGNLKKWIHSRYVLEAGPWCYRVCCCVGGERGKHKGAFIDFDVNKTQPIFEAPAFLSVQVFVLSILISLTSFRQQYQCLIGKDYLCSSNLTQCSHGDSVIARMAWNQDKYQTRCQSQLEATIHDKTTRGMVLGLSFILYPFVLSIISTLAIPPNIYCNNCPVAEVSCADCGVVFHSDPIPVNDLPPSVNPVIFYGAAYLIFLVSRYLLGSVVPVPSLHPQIQR